MQTMYGSETSADSCASFHEAAYPMWSPADYLLGSTYTYGQLGKNLNKLKHVSQDIDCEQKINNEESYEYTEHTM